MGEAPDRQAHWDERYTTGGPTEVSWFEPEPTTSLELFVEAGITHDDPVIDVGGGASLLVDRLLRRGFGDVTVLDVSQVALDLARARVGDDPAVTWIHADLLAWAPDRRWEVWHDRAVFHFLTDPDDRAAYCDLLDRALAPDGLVVVAAFAPDGPETCSGLPVVRYSAAALTSELGAAEVVEARRTEHRTPWGTAQPFTWVALRR